VNSAKDLVDGSDDNGGVTVGRGCIAFSHEGLRLGHHRCNQQVLSMGVLKVSISFRKEASFCSLGVSSGGRFFCRYV
jgi:hypothetical protein